MWLLKLHFAFSVLCLITGFGFFALCRDEILKHGWIDPEKKNGRITVLLWFFVPLLNVFLVVLIFAAIAYDREYLRNCIEKLSKERESKC